MQKAVLLAIALPLLLAFAVPACAPTTRSDTPATVHASSPTATRPAQSPTIAADARSKIHAASPDYIPLFASITFTRGTSYDQAVAILQRHVYPWTCDEPRSNIPPPLAEQQASFSASHALLMSYPVWDELLRIASSTQVIAVEGTVLYPCP
ncbi:MAG TPA: hypothetical protein VF040_08995 [Ktedonobacterales bacterium]